jgi:hypothetical protein
MSDRWSRRAPLTAVIFVALLGVTFGLSWNTPDSNASAAKVISYYQAHRSDEMTANFLGGLAVVFFMFFAAALRAYLRRTAHADGLVALGFAGGVLIAVGGALFSSFGLALSDYPGRLEPAAAHALNLLSNDSFFPLAVGVSAFMIGNGLAITRSAVLPRWLGWVAFVIGILGATPVGIFAFMALMVWTLVVAVLIYARSAPSVKPPPASPPGGAPATSP